MSPILLYILLFLCVCCLCGIGVVMRRRERSEMMSRDGNDGTVSSSDDAILAEVREGVRSIILSIDGIIADGKDPKMVSQLTVIRADVERLLATVDNRSDVSAGDVNEQIAPDVQVPEVDEQPVAAPPKRELSPVLEVTGDRMDIFDLLDDPLVEKAVKYVETNMQRADLSVEQVSAYLDVSRVYLYKKIKSATGLTPIEFIRLTRLRRAAQMLREGGVTVSEVAGSVGFNSPRNFSKYFRDEFGVLPSAYQSQI
ncbi:MAG: helix-turn-helix transcriptional regulator [Duncaniella sp.]|nr:helix-turn-helix transcriptional regulator [Duncaniella sp.]